MRTILFPAVLLCFLVSGCAYSDISMVLANDSGEAIQLLGPGDMETAANVVEPDGVRSWRGRVHDGETLTFEALRDDGQSEVVECGFTVAWDRSLFFPQRSFTLRWLGDEFESCMIDIVDNPDL